MGTGRVMWALPLLAVVLSGCGGGGEGAATPADRQAAAKPVAVGEPQGSKIDTAPFVALAQASACADRHNRLYVIDKTYVFHTRAGSCPDNSYANNLYGAATDKLLCSQHDSIAAPQSRCSDDKARAVFDTVVKNLDAANLGLDASHEVQKVDVAQPAPEFTELSHSKHSGVDAEQHLVIKDAGTFTRLWDQHTGGSAPAPRIDFDRGMVLAVFMGTRPNGCYDTRIAAVTHQDGKILVTREDTVPAEGAICTMAMTSPGHLVAIDRSDAPVEFLVRKAPAR